MDQEELLEQLELQQPLLPPQEQEEKQEHHHIALQDNNLHPTAQAMVNLEPTERVELVELE